MKKNLSKKINKCPLCRSENIKIKYNNIGDRSYHVTAKKFNIFLCNGCKSYFLGPIPDKEEIDSFYDINYGAYSRINLEITYRWWERLVINKKNLYTIDRLILFFFTEFFGFDNRIIDLLTYVKANKKSFSKILDIGCGSGNFTMQLIKFLNLDKEKITGIDILPSVEDFGKELGIRMKKSRLEEYSEYNFDLITLSHVLEHEPNPRKLIEEIYKRLDDGGIFYLSLPNSQSLPAKLFPKTWCSHDVPRHIYCFSKQSILNITKDLFELELYSSCKFYHFYFNIYFKSKFIKLFINKYTARPINCLIYLLCFISDLGDNQNFIFKKKKNGQITSLQV